MSELVHPQRIIDIAGKFQQRMRAEFGAPVQSPLVAAVPVLEPTGGAGTYDHLPSASSEIIVVAAHETLVRQLNACRKIGDATIFSPQFHLSDGLHPGMGFGLLKNGNVYPSVISPRTTKGELHILYLDSDGMPFPALRDLRGSSSPIDRLALRGSYDAQRRSVGVDHVASQGIATELGHSLLGVGALTSRALSGQIAARIHPVHQMAESSVGIMPTLASSNGANVLSHKERPLTTAEEIITIQGVAAVFLVDHPVFRSLSIGGDASTVDDQINAVLTPAEQLLALSTSAAADKLETTPERIGDLLMGVYHQL